MTGDHRGLQPGDVVDHFQLVRPVGRGGMGEVYLARDCRLGRRVALKVIHPERLGSSSAVDRFVKEARATARLNHPHIVTIYHTGETRGRPYLALEYLEGQTLRRRLQEGRCGRAEALRIGQAVAEAIAEAHAQRILHRDLKPENVVIPRDGRLRVVDFGLAKLIDPGEAITRSQHAAAGADGADPGAADTPTLPEDAAASVLSRQGAIRGTPEYMAPEQWLEAEVTAATDVWALGTLLYELVAGQRPYGDASFFTLAIKVGEPEPVPPLPNARELPRDLAELVQIGRAHV